MDVNNPVIKLCIEGSQAEFRGSITAAQRCYQQAWAIAQDNYEACIAAHYVARHQPTPEAALWWNQIALERANAVADERVQAFYGSLYLTLGYSYEVVGDLAVAQHYYALAAALGFVHQVN